LVPPRIFNSINHRLHITTETQQYEFRVISRFLRGVNEICCLLGFYATGQPIGTIFKGLEGGPETSVINYRSTLRKNPKRAQISIDLFRWNFTLKKWNLFLVELLKSDEN